MKSIKQIFIIMVLFNSVLAPAFGHVSQESICGVIEELQGEVQLLSANRMHITDAQPNKTIACGSWLSTIQGWAKVRLHHGPVLQIGNQSFIQWIPPAESKKGSRTATTDHVALYRGQIYCDVTQGSQELRVISPVARARISQGRVILISSESENESQLIALEKSATLENRFESSRKVKVQAGESTSLNLKLQRVIPTPPKAVSVASLKPRLYDLQLSDEIISKAVLVATQRHDRRIAAELGPSNGNGNGNGNGHHPQNKDSENPEGEKQKQDQHPTVVNRAPSSSQPTTEPTESEKYARNPKISDGTDHPNLGADLHDHWVRKMVGDADIGEEILYPQKFYGKTQRISLEIEEPNGKLKTKLQKEEEVEKKRLIEELSDIRAE